MSKQRKAARKPARKTKRRRVRRPRAVAVAEFGLVDAGGVIKTGMFETKPPDVAGKGWKWLPVVTVGDDPFDPATQAKDGPVLSGNASASQVTKTFTVRALTAAELSAGKDAQVANLSNVLFQIAFNHENRIRALEAKAAITAAQFKAAIKAML